MQVGITHIPQSWFALFKLVMVYKVVAYFQLNPRKKMKKNQTRGKGTCERHTEKF